MGTASDQAVHYAHPYYPTSLSLPGYHPLVIPFETILAIFFGGFAVAFLGTWVLSGRFPKLSVGERLLTCWFVCTGIIHLVIEGAVVVNSEFYKDTSGNILNEIWKEYAKADSRYATRDAFTISMEAVTAFIEGPACFLIAYGILAAKPFRFSAIVLVSLGQLYGDVLYYMTCRHHGWSHHSRPEALYFWFYFVIVNAIWIVVPLTCIVYAVTNINAAVAQAGPRSGSKSKKKQ